MNSEWKNIMAESSQELADFETSSFLLFCLDDNGNIAFETSWGQTVEDAQRFAILLSKITNNELTTDLLKQLKEISKNEKNGKKKYSIVEGIVNKKEDSDLVVLPTEVDIA